MKKKTFAMTSCQEESLRWKNFSTIVTIALALSFAATFPTTFSGNSFFFIFSDLLLCLNVRLLYVHIHRRSHKDFFLCNSYYIVYISAFYINDEYISIWIMYLAKIELTYSICVLNCLCNIHKTFIHVVCMFCFIVTPSFISISFTVLFSFTHFFKHIFCLYLCVFCVHVCLQSKQMPFNRLHKVRYIILISSIL